MKSIFRWFMNLFKNNLTIMQLAVMSIAGEIFKANPKLKSQVGAVLDKVLVSINITDITPVQVSELIKSQIKLSTLLPPEQALALTLVDSVSIQVAAYIAKTGLSTQDAQMQIVYQVLSWINSMTKV